MTTSLDYFAFPAEKEIYGFKKYSTDAEAAALTQWDFYKVSSNRTKYNATDREAGYCFLRSPYTSANSYFCICRDPLNPGGLNADSTGGCVAPFGCI